MHRIRLSRSHPTPGQRSTLELKANRNKTYYRIKSLVLNGVDIMQPSCKILHMKFECLRQEALAK